MKRCLNYLTVKERDTRAAGGGRQEKERQGQPGPRGGRSHIDKADAVASALGHDRQGLADGGRGLAKDRRGGTRSALLGRRDKPRGRGDSRPSREWAKRTWRSSQYPPRPAGSAASRRRKTSVEICADHVD